MKHPQAKVWACEDEPEVLAVVRDRRNQQDIIFERWQKTVSPTSKARWGVQAPEAERLVVMGAWLSPDGYIEVDQGKLTRNEDIFRFGFS